MSTTPTSPKVTVAGLTAAATTVIMYLLGQIPAIAAWPEPVKGALLVLVTAGVTYGASYAKGDPLRGFTPQHRRGGDFHSESGHSTVELLLLVAVLVVVLLLLFGAFA